jgi:diaminohydroxyphosphoribosylaminopyrimidine deaminase / 5-amino-6-(5-phosphoribosylamino)uracil reductase
MFSELDRAMMARALALAEKGLYTATPNPRVGCVIAKDHAVVGEGWHEKAGSPHAEMAPPRRAPPSTSRSSPATTSAARRRAPARW